MLIQLLNTLNLGGEKVRMLNDRISKSFLFKGASVILAIIVLITIMLYDVPKNNSWSAWTLPLSGKIIVLDAGHGGPDGGAVSKTGIIEKDITLKITEILKDYLNEAGALVILTRETDTDLANSGTRGIAKRKFEDLQNRVRLVNNSMADLFISIHLNSIPSERWHGAQTFYYPLNENNKRLATSIQNEIIRNLENTDRTPLPRNDIMILKYTKTTAAMVEAGFLSNPNESTYLIDPDYQKKIAFAVYQGILAYYTDEDLDKKTGNES